MPINFEDFLDAAQQIDNQSDLEALYRKAVADEGYQNVIFLHLSRKKSPSLKISDFPDGYQEMYSSRKFDLIDPILRQTSVAKRPFAWAPIADGRNRTREEKNFFEECREMGVHDGVTMPFHNPDGSTHIISLSLRDGPRPDPRRIPFVYALSAQTWVRHSALEEENKGDGEQIRLTERERECLSWAKDGKTNWEISQIISIAERTVEFHIGNAMRKLNASNRITAIVIAIQEGLIGL